MVLDTAFRMVYHKPKKLLFIQPRRQGLYNGVVNGEAAAILLNLNRDKEDRAALKKHYAKNPDFIEQCFKRGWINRNLQLASDIRTLEANHHLKSVQIEILLRCNLSCGYCYCSAGNKRHEKLTAFAIMGILDDAEKLGTMSVDFTGGEFFLHPDWKAILQHGAKLGLGLSIHTNGMALTEENVKYLAAIGVFRVQVTADGGESDTHNKVRGHDSAFQLMVAGIRRLVANGIRPRINIMVHKHTKDKLPDIISYFQSEGVSINFDWVAPFGSEKNSHLGISPAEYFEAVAPLRATESAFRRAIPCGRDLSWNLSDYEPDCGVGQSYVFVTATGEMAICPILTSRENRELFGGPNIADVSLYDAWLKHPFFDRHRYVNCENVQTCPVGTACRGGCRANAYAQSAGKINAPNIIECNVRKNKTPRFVNFYERYAQGNFDTVNAETETLPGETSADVGALS